MANVRWTNEMLLTEAKKYSTRRSFAKGSPSVQFLCRARGILEEACSHMEMRVTIWTREKVKNEALEYESRSSFKKGSPIAYKNACRWGILDDVCGHMIHQRPVRTKEEVREASLLYTTQREFELNNSTLFNYAKNHKWLDEVCPHLIKSVTLWTDEMLADEALKYETRSDFGRGNPSAYTTAKTRGLMGTICRHMIVRNGQDNDSVYIWKAVGLYYDGLPVYKVGTTSKRLGDIRIGNVSRKWKVDAEIVILRVVVGQATRVESQLKKIGINPKFSESDGFSEMRAMTDEELTSAVEIVKRNSKVYLAVA